jgi:AP-3 complex subunit delta-1
MRPREQTQTCNKILFHLRLEHKTLTTCTRFEKDLYDLIRGLRNHKGTEKEYIAASIKECRKEIRGNDMDLKSTALMKLTYLEMFGHDMSWASFNVLEVMSSPKYRHKRTGYLAAVQSFRRDTEVLMLAENQLKKDIASPTPTVISLPLGAIPHVINPSMANSVLSDLLPRLTHSSPAIRKKTVVTLYRLALVYPETLRPAWPKIKERLQDEREDPSVTAAIVNVICELGWRRPQDYLPLAPRLFDLLVEGGNNWMAIKLIKLVSMNIISSECSANTVIVCDLDTTRTQTYQKAASTAYKDYQRDLGNVPVVRMHQWHYSGWYIGGR